MALALYRKYRPKRLEDVLGHDTVISILRNAAAADRLGHAYLFHGPRGTGKTTTARLIAKLLNCERRATDEKFRKEGEPCNDCTNCTEIDASIAFDVVEIDAASNRGIDEIRNLKENVRTAPAKGRSKVYIIDEAHMLTGPAFNALLKTLEEPPKHATFVLATTEYEKLPPTITSRAQRFLFKRAPKSIIMKKLKEVASTEKIDIDDTALELIAAAGEGSFRDAESLLDQIAAIGEHIDLETAERLIGRAGLQKIERLAELILGKKLDLAVHALSEIHEEGYNLVGLTKDLIHYLRKVLTLTFNSSLEAAFETELTKEEIARMKKLLTLAKPEEQVAVLKALLRAWSEMRYSPFAIVPLEIALIETIGK